MRKYVFLILILMVFLSGCDYNGKYGDYRKKDDSPVFTPAPTGQPQWYDKAVENAPTVKPSNNDTPKSTPVPNAKPAFQGVSNDMFSEIKAGMSYSQVVKIVHGEGERIAKMEDYVDSSLIDPKYETKMYRWISANKQYYVVCAFMADSLYYKDSYPVN